MAIFFFTPKTDWTSEDYVERLDVERWIHNLNVLRDMIIAAGGSFALGWTELDGISTEYSDALSGSDYTKIEWDLWRCAKAVKDTLGGAINYFPSYKGWADNGLAPDYQRLNLIETVMLNIYNFILETDYSPSDLIALLDGTEETYHSIMRRWMAYNGGLFDYTPTTLTALCEEWYEQTRTGWNGYTTFANPSNSTSSYGTKGGHNADMVCVPSTNAIKGRDDYAGNPLFAVTTVNWTLDSDGNPLITAIKGIHNSFEQDNPSKLVGVMQMSGSPYVINLEDGSTKIGYMDYIGTGVLPEAVKTDGTKSQFVLHGKYMMGKYNNAPTCCSGVLPWRNLSHNTAVTVPDALGSMYSGSCITDWAFAILMTVIKYGSMTADGILNGCYEYNYQCPSVVAETDVKRVIISTSDAKNLVVGSTVLIGNYNGSFSRHNTSMYSISEGARITAIQNVKVGSNTYSAVYVDTDFTFSTGANGSGAYGTTYISTLPWASGMCDNVLGNDGQAVADYKHPTMIQGIEFATGANEMIADTILSVASNEIVPYIARRTSYQGSSTANAEASSLSLARPSTARLNYIKSMAYDGNIFFPAAVGASIYTYTRDGIYITEDIAAYKALSVFGRLKSGSGEGGIMCCAAWDALADSNFSMATRISPNGNRGAE